MFTRSFLKRLLILLLSCSTMAGSLCCLAQADVKAHKKSGKILFISSFNAAHPWPRNTLEGFSEHFRDSDRLDVQIEAVTLNAIVFELIQASGETFAKALEKVKTEKPDIAVIVDMPAIAFFLANASEIPEEVSLIFCGYPNFFDLPPQGRHNFHFVAKPEYFETNIDLALRLFPNTKQIAIITDAGPDGTAADKHLKETLKNFDAAEIDLINGRHYSTHEMLVKVADMPKDSVVIYADWVSAKHGYFVSYEGMLARLAQTDVPIFTISETDSREVFGGIMVDGMQNGKAAAMLAEKILLEGAAQYVVEGYAFAKFNYPVLEKFGISESDLPRYSVIAGRSPSFWFTYRYAITLGSFLTLVAIIWIAAVAKRNRIIRANAFIYSKLPVRIVAYDKDNYLIFNHSVDAQIQKLLKYGKKNFHLSELPDEIYIPFMKGLKAARETGNEENVVYHCVDSYRMATFVKLPEKNFGKDAVMIFSVDITDIENSKQAAQAADKAKSLFIATVSHELRTPLNAVIGYSELSQDRSLDPDTVVDNLKSINSAANSLLNLINDVLDISRLEAGQMEIAKSPTDLKALMDEMLDVFKFRAAKQRIALDCVFASEVPMLYLDSLRIKQVLMNIIGNAVKFTDSGSVGVEILFEPDSENAGTLRIKVSDTGMGIAPEYLQKIFNPFERQPANKTKGAYSGEGTGLGLAISQRLVREMDGDIEVESELGKGSAFGIAIPNVEIFKGKMKIAESSAIKPALSELSIPGKVMILDDIAMNLKVLEAVLRKIGADVVSSLSGAHALELLKAEKPAIILTDLWMPEMDGEVFSKKVRENPAYAGIPIVAVTADTQIKNSGKVFDEILLKPITVEKVRAVLEKCLGAESGKTS